MTRQTEQPATLNAAIAKLGLAVEADFVPADKGATDAELRLNWRVRVIHKGRTILESPYTQGVGHCPAYKAGIKELGGRGCIMRWDAVRRECLTGETWRAPFTGESRNRIPAPNAADVIYSVVSDASAIDYATFEDWACEYGYDDDSREAERIYRTCLEFGLKLRAALGESGLATLRDATQNY